MPKQAKAPAPEAKEISEENRRLAEEFEKEIDLKVGDLEADDVFDVLPVEEAKVGTESGDYVIEIPVGPKVTKDDIAMKLKGRILTLDITTRDEAAQTTVQIGKMLNLPENIDLGQLKSVVTAEGNLKLQAPYVLQQAPAAAGQSPDSIVLQLHNELRKKHGAPPLQLVPELSKVAETSAKALAKGSAVNLDEASLGQNTFEAPGSVELDAAKEAANYWYGQGKDFNWTDPVNSPPSTRAFAEVVCKSTSFLGVGVVTQGDKIVVVALYSRPGALLKEADKLKENVLPSS